MNDPINLSRKMEGMSSEMVAVTRAESIPDGPPGERLMIELGEGTADPDPDPDPDPEPEAEADPPPLSGSEGLRNVLGSL